MRVIRPISLAMANAIEKNQRHPVAQQIIKKVSTDPNYGVKNMPRISVRSKQIGNIDVG